jgi:hypothetical protein
MRRPIATFIGASLLAMSPLGAKAMTGLEVAAAVIFVPPLIAALSSPYYYRDGYYRGHAYREPYYAPAYYPAYRPAPVYYRPAYVPRYPVYYERRPVVVYRDRYYDDRRYRYGW